MHRKNIHSFSDSMDDGTAIKPNTDKPVIVRVKRKASQSLLDAFWLEINERPTKRPLLDFEKLSISGSSSNRVEELKTKKVLVRHVETVITSEVTVDVLRSFVPNSSDALEPKEKNGGRRCTFKTENKQEQLLVKARQRQEVLSKNARFEQIWRSRKGKNEAVEDDAVHEMYRLYDVVRVDAEKRENEVQEEDTELEDHRMMAQYLPLLREVLPTAAVEIEDDIHNYAARQAFSDDYVYDFYAVKGDANITDADSASQFPLVQVDDDTFYDGPDDSEYETDDSNGRRTIRSMSIRMKRHLRMRM
ncbi:RNA-directed DNA methylation 4 [Olea europaea subsp. europaea]|uniref:RNA-directed DNA methylation 4 n=1 Tax=Olea europaea subsp. europaea TaxID=158383 RepID=A0A8S0SCK4_OLEEU|nr:RNA-directed DNA methylation 4 [Olea europaea subsp. europaea]